MWGFPLWDKTEFYDHVCDINISMEAFFHANIISKMASAPPV